MTSLVLATVESLPPVTWPQVGLAAIGALCFVSFIGLVVTERWPWQR